MSIANTFNEFCSNLNIPQRVVDSIRNRYQTITSRINSDYWNIDSNTLHSLYVGSYGRDTEIHTSDIDILVILPNEVFHRFNRYLFGSQSSLLQEVKEVI